MKLVQRILFVDDEPAVLEGVRHALRRMPCEILTAESAAQGLEVLSRVSIDVVVSDERMPGMCGSEFLGIVCRKYPNTIRIILTGQASLDSAIRAINDGEIFRFLLKPCNPIDLAFTIRNALMVKSLHEESARLLAEVRRRGTLLRELERRSPGITAVSRGRDGTIDLDAEGIADLGTLVSEIHRELEEPWLGSTGGGDERRSA